MTTVKDCSVITHVKPLFLSEAHFFVAKLIQNVESASFVPSLMLCCYELFSLEHGANDTIIIWAFSQHYGGGGGGAESIGL